MRTPADDHPAPPLTALPAAPRQHDRVANVLRTMIQRDWQPGQALPSVRELRQLLQVSMPTLQAAQAVLQREGLLEIHQGRGVYVARQARRWRVGVVSELDLLHPRTGSYFRSLARAVAARLSDLDATPDLYNGRTASPEPQETPVARRFWGDVTAGRLDGAVILNRHSSLAWDTRTAASPIPLVGAGTALNVVTDSPAVVTACVRSLAEQGCRRVALMSWELGRVRAAFHAAVAAAGLTTAPHWLKGDLDPVQPGAGWDEFRELWAAPGAKPDGLIILDDLLFMDAQLAIFELGLRVPQDLRVAVQTNRGADLPIRLPVTTFEIDAEPAGQALAETLLRRLRGEQVMPAPVCHLTATCQPAPIALAAARPVRSRPRRQGVAAEAYGHQA